MSNLPRRSLFWHLFHRSFPSDCRWTKQDGEKRKLKIIGQIIGQSWDVATCNCRILFISIIHCNIWYWYIMMHQYYQFRQTAKSWGIAWPIPPQAVCLTLPTPHLCRVDSLLDAWSTLDARQTKAQCRVAEGTRWVCSMQKHNFFSVVCTYRIWHFQVRQPVMKV